MKKNTDLNRFSTCTQDTPVEGLSEVELQDQEDFLSSDEYECASPDDISLPPLAETPESNVVQSDLEEGHCFSSRSAHSNQHNHQSHSHLEYIGNGAVQEQRGLSQAKCCPTPPGSLQSSTRSVRRQVTLKHNPFVWCRDSQHRQNQLHQPQLFDFLTFHHAKFLQVVFSCCHQCSVTENQH